MTGSSEEKYRPTPKEQQALADAAHAAAERAYAPYSNFPVGAAVLDEQGRIFSGCNVENASFGLTICAERNAVAAAIHAGAKAIRAVAVWTPQAQAIPPCGACRQVLAEFGPAMPVYMLSSNGQDRIMTLDQLLPAQFTPDQLVDAQQKP